MPWRRLLAQLPTPAMAILILSILLRSRRPLVEGAMAVTFLSLEQGEGATPRSGAGVFRCHLLGGWRRRWAIASTGRSCRRRPAGGARRRARGVRRGAW